MVYFTIEKHLQDDDFYWRKNFRDLPRKAQYLGRLEGDLTGSAHWI